MTGRQIFLFLLTLLAIVPLPFAAVHVWAWGLLVTVSGGLLLAWSVGAATGRIAPPQLRWTGPLPVLFMMIVGWSLFQIAPFSPAAWHHPLWREAAVTLQTPLPGAIALNPGKGFGVLLRFCSYAAVFWLCLQYGTQASQAKAMITTIAGAAVAYATYGLIAYFSGSMTILWFPKEAYVTDLTSTFVNKNNYATYAGLGWLCLLALFYRAYRQSIAGVKPATEKWRHTLLFLEKAGWRYLIGMFLLIGALLYSHSRAGFACSVAGILVFCIALSFNRATDRKLVRRFGLVSVLLAIVLFSVSGRVIDERIGKTDLSQEERPRVYSLTWKAIGDQILLGSGLGSFEDLFRFYRTADIRSVFTYAHDSYLEAALEWGLPAASLLIGGLLFMTGVNIRGARFRRRDEIYPCLGLGATTLVGLHSLLDFSVQIPAVAVTYAAILGVAFAQSWNSVPAKKNA